MENKREKPDGSCRTIAAATTYVGIPLLAATPSVIIYVITGDLGNAVAYPIVAACLLPIGLAALAAVLFAVTYLIHESWENIAMPIAKRCQNLKDHRRQKAREQAL